MNNKKKKNAVVILQILAERIKFTFRPFGIAGKATLI